MKRLMTTFFAETVSQGTHELGVWNIKFGDVETIFSGDNQPIAMSNEMAIRRIRDHMHVHNIREPHAYYINIALNKAIVALGQIDEAKEVIIDLLNQFAYTGQKDGRAMIWTGGLSALESGFSFVGWDDPHFTPELECNHEGCYELATSGAPTPMGYKRLCLKHYQELEAEQN